MTTQEIIIAGFGGQGILLMGQLLAEAGQIEDKPVSWIPSYGHEMRGGTASCAVIISDEKIGSPLVEHPTLLVPMNKPSFLKFEPLVQSGGMMIMNSSMISDEPRRNDLSVHKIPMNKLAAEISEKTLNVIGLGAIVALSRVVAKESVCLAIEKLFGKKFADKPKVLAMNMEAFEKGYAAAEAC
jgi:2-oxoglutarate ferredoxin oxidoreductase subunit gamma